MTRTTNTICLALGTLWAGVLLSTFLCPSLWFWIGVQLGQSPHYFQGGAGGVALIFFAFTAGVGVAGHHVVMKVKRHNASCSMVQEHMDYPDETNMCLLGLPSVAGFSGAASIALVFESVRLLSRHQPVSGLLGLIMASILALVAWLVLRAIYRHHFDLITVPDSEAEEYSAQA